MGIYVVVNGRLWCLVNGQLPINKYKLYVYGGGYRYSLDSKYIPKIVRDTFNDLMLAGF